MTGTLARVAVEVPYVTDDGRMGWGWQFTAADLADIGMASELWWASPDGQAEYRRFLDGLPDGSTQVGGYWET